MKETCETQNKPKTFKEMIRSAYFWKPASAVIIGGTIGFLYYHFVGCASGSCGITSNPFSSVLMGSAMGYFVVNSPCKTC
jgi:urea transporter